MFKYILWDLDGTIANTYEGISRSMIWALSQFDFRLEDEEKVREFIGPPLRVSIPKVTGFDMEKTEQVVTKFRERYIPIGVYECQLFPGVSEAMDRFTTAGKVQVISSSKPQEQCRKVLGKLGVLEKMQHVFGATLDGRIDTKLQVLEETFRVLAEEYPDFDKGQAILIGDTQFDAIGAREAGIACIGVSYGFGSRQELIENGVIAVCDTPDQVCDWLINEE